MEDKQEYMDELQRRSRESRVYKQYQMIGLLIAEALDDEAHKSLYIKLAKEHDGDELLQIAKDVADRKGIDNKGAYFMKILESKKLLKK